MKERLYLGTRKGLFALERADRDSEWEMASLSFRGVEVPMLLPDAWNDALYAAVQHGHFGTKLHRSRDHGQTWVEIGTPAYPPKPDNVPDVINPMDNKPIPWNLEKIWCLESGGRDRPDRLWCGTIPGGLFKSEDDGATWELVMPLWNRPERAHWFGGGYDNPGIHSICVDPENNDRVSIAISCGGVWVTEDAGETWTVKSSGLRAEYMPPERAGDPDIQDPHRMVQCQGDPKSLWIQHHNGIFRSVDGCESWQEIEGVKPSGFGFAVAVHPKDAKTAWFVPAEKDEMRVPVDDTVVVNRTRDGGKSFETITEGLPPLPAYDLVYRHCLDVDPSGDVLAFGSTTGTAWTSDDQGETWRTLRANLPPVYCVRFGH